MSATYSRCCHCTAILTISDTCAFCHHPSCPTCHASSTPLPGTHTNHFDIATMTPSSPLSPLASPFALNRNLNMKVRTERERREMEGRQRMRRMSAERDEAVRARRVARETMGGMGSA